MLKVQRDRGIIKIFHGMFGIEQIVKGDFDPFACVPRFSSLPLRTLWKVAPASSIIIAPNKPCIW